MKRLLKSSGEYILFFLQVFLIGLFTLILIGVNMQIQEKDFFKNNMFNANVSGVRVSRQAAALSFDIREDAEFMLYKHIADDADEITRGIDGTGDVFGFADFIETGRFFEVSDYQSSTRTAVIGPRVLPYTVIEDGVRYYGYNRQRYEVIGVFYETGTNLDRAVYLNLAGLLQDEGISGTYYADAKDKETAEAVIAGILAYAEGRFDAVPTDYRLPPAELDTPTKALLDFSILTAVFCIAVTAIFFVTQQKYAVSIRKLCGMTRLGLLRMYALRIFAVILASFALIVPVMLVLSSTFKGSVFSMKALSWHYYAAAGIVLSALGIIMTLFIVKLTQRVDISATLKGK